MLRGVRFLVIAFAVVSLHAQTEPAGRAFPEATWPVIITGEVGTQQSLGYLPLHLAAGIGLEKRAGRWMELDPSISWSPDRTLLTHDGNAVSFQAAAIMWSGVSREIGITGGFAYTRLWTSQFRHGSISPSLGMAARLHAWRVPGRLYATYVVPYGGFDVRTGLENSRSHGPKVYFEGQVATRLRLGLEVAAYRFLGQDNNPACSSSSHSAPCWCCWNGTTCSGSNAGHWGTAAALVIRVTPRQSTGALY